MHKNNIIIIIIKEDHREREVFTHNNVSWSSIDKHNEGETRLLNWSTSQRNSHGSDMTPKKMFFRNTVNEVDPILTASVIAESDMRQYCQQTEGQSANNDSDVIVNSTEWKGLPANDETTITLIEKLIMGEKEVEDGINQAMVQAEDSSNDQNHVNPQET